MKPGGLLARLRDILAGFLESRASGYVRFELAESRNLFAVLVFAPFVGIPIMPASISLELLPYMEEHLETALDRLFNLDDPWGVVGGRFDAE